MDLQRLVERAQAGDVEAYGRVVRDTQALAYAVALRVLRDTGLAEDAVQESYVRAYRRLRDLNDPGAFAGWLRRTVISVALNMRRTRRRTFLRLEDVPDVPVLDETETVWTDLQRQQLAQAMLTLTTEERRLCDRYYHGHWTVARLAREAGVGEPVMRKRLQRVRDKLRKKVEMEEQDDAKTTPTVGDLPARIVELLARPRLSDLPENPVGRVLDDLRASYAEFADVVLPEVLDLAEARTTIGDDALYIDPVELHRVDERRILRYDLTLPLLLTVRYEDRPVRIFTAGKAYRRCRVDAMHLEAFHQAEILWIDNTSVLDPWQLTGRILASIDRVLPGRTLKILPTTYTMCSQAWELEIEDDGRWLEVLAWGVFTNKILRHLGADPASQRAVGVGCGLERLAMLRYGIDDARKVDAAHVA